MVKDGEAGGRGGSSTEWILGRTLWGFIQTSRNPVILIYILAVKIPGQYDLVFDQHLHNFQASVRPHCWSKDSPEAL